MTEKLPIIAYFITLTLLVISSVIALTRQKKLILIFGVFSLIFSLSGVLMVLFTTGHLPMSGTFEKMQNIVLIITAIGVYYSFRDKNKNFKSVDFWFFALFFSYMFSQMN